ncbi:MAG: DUF4276 family protein [Myxococcaceae bacterium]
MNKVLLLVEGQTEEEFVAEVLRPELRGVGVELVPVLLKTKRVKSGGHFRGGVSNYAAVRGDVLRLLKDSSAALVSSILDLYGLPADFPGVGERGANASAWALNVERAWQADIGSDRFRPYLSIHEFEAFAFVAPDRCTTVFSPSQADSLAKVSQAFGGHVESINDGPTTHPSARVAAIRSGYEKPVHGALITIETGLDRLAAASPHFSSFLSMLRAQGAVS